MPCPCPYVSFICVRLHFSTVPSELSRSTLFTEFTVQQGACRRRRRSQRPRRKRISAVRAGTHRKRGENDQSMSCVPRVRQRRGWLSERRRSAFAHSRRSTLTHRACVVAMVDLSGRGRSTLFFLTSQRLSKVPQLAPQLARHVPCRFPEMRLIAVRRFHQSGVCYAAGFLWIRQSAVLAKPRCGKNATRSAIEWPQHRASERALQTRRV